MKLNNLQWLYDTDQDFRYLVEKYAVDNGFSYNLKEACIWLLDEHKSKVRKGTSYKDVPPHEKSEESRHFEQEVDAELGFLDYHRLTTERDNFLTDKRYWFNKYNDLYKEFTRVCEMYDMRCLDLEAQRDVWKNQAKYIEKKYKGD